MTTFTSSLRPGDDLRHYRIERQIGAGGMGIVYEARHHTLDYRVAIKAFAFPSPTTAEDTNARNLHQAALDAFIAEARVLITLDHDDIPAGGADIPKVYDLFQENGSWFLVMEFISGQTLEQILIERGGTVPVEEVVKWGESILKTLTFLHQQQPPVIHRDIKPGNLKLNEQGRMVILDFGIAKSGSIIARDQRTSSTSQFVSFHYAPPEQLRGRGTDARSDIFALAGTLYLLMTGEHPPDAQERVNTTLLDRQPDPLRLANELNPAIPRYLAEALQQALAIQPNQRFENAEAFRQALADPWGQAADYSGLLTTTAPTANIKTGAVSSPATPLSPASPTKSRSSVHLPATPTEDVVYRPVSAPLTAESRRSPLIGVMAGFLLLLMAGGILGVWQGWLPLPIGIGGNAIALNEGVSVPTAENEGVVVVATATPEPTFTPNSLPTAESVNTSAETGGVVQSTSTPLSIPTVTATPGETPTETPIPTATATEIVIIPTPTATETSRPVRPSATTAAPFATDTPAPSPTATWAAPSAPPAAATATPPPPPPPTPPVRPTPRLWYGIRLPGGKLESMI